MITPLDRAINKTVINIEQGYSNNQNDLGGETYYGISRRFFPGWVGWNLIDHYKNKKIPLGQLDKKLFPLVKGFYREQFWNRILGEELYDISDEVCLEVFDTAVNLSVHKSITILQKSLNLLNRNQKLYKDLLIDGKIGDITLGATHQLLKYDKPSTLIILMNCYQAGHYIDLTERNPVQEHNLRGWLNKRVDICYGKQTRSRSDLNTAKEYS